MVAEGTLAVTITFALAIIGYIGMTATLIRTNLKSLPRGFWIATVVIIIIHVFMIWQVRYGWEFGLAVRNGCGGFVVFHAAFLLIVGSVFTGNALSRRLLHISFIIVTAGATGAVFIYDAVSIYRIPVIICGVAGVGSLMHYYAGHVLAKTKTSNLDSHKAKSNPR